MPGQLGCGVLRAAVLACVGVVGGFGLGWVSYAHGSATGNTIGVTWHDSARTEAGFTLFAPMSATNTYLVDMHGQLVRRWSSAHLPGATAYLSPNGHLVRAARWGDWFNTGGAGGRVEEYDWSGSLVWAANFSTMAHRQHHDALPLPNGNVLMILWERKSASEAAAAGRDPARIAQGEVWPDYLLEVKPNDEGGYDAVWEWHSWDHLIQEHDASQSNYGAVGEHPELIDVNYGTVRSDWLHVNGIDYHAELDQILLSVHGFDEIWVIDHSTTTEEAAGRTGGRSGRGGDLLYRWGNPAAYRAGSAEDQQLYGQHNPHWIGPQLPGAGHMLIFNNGAGRPQGNASSVDEIAPPIDETGAYTMPGTGPFGPDQPVWSYSADPPESFYAANVSGAQRLPNGNTLICQGPIGRFFEVTSQGEVVWHYVSPVAASGLASQGNPPPNLNSVFRAYRYAADDPRFLGRDMTPLGSVELPETYAFVLTGFEPQSESARLTWSSLPDRRYLVQWRAELDSATDWMDVGVAVALGTASHYVDVDAARLGRRLGFYRVLEVP